MSQTALFIASTPNDGLRVAGVLAVYLGLFAAPALARWAARLRLKLNWVPVGPTLAVACVLFFLWSYYLIGSELTSVAIDERNGGSFRFEGNYVAPVLALPWVWVGLHVFDESLVQLKKVIT